MSAGMTGEGRPGGGGSGAEHAAGMRWWGWGEEGKRFPLPPRAEAMLADELDATSLIARIGAGRRGPEAEAALAAEGMTLGPFPHSFEYATIGGFAATRSAGQATSASGRFDALVTSARLIAPTGELRTLETPHSAAGPALRELILGSEGTLGIVTDIEAR